VPTIWITISLDETTRLSDVADIINIFANTPDAIAFDYAQDETNNIPGALMRTSDFLQQDVFQHAPFRITNDALYQVFGEQRFVA